MKIGEITGEKWDGTQNLNLKSRCCARKPWRLP